MLCVFMLAYTLHIVATRNVISDENFLTEEFHVVGHFTNKIKNFQ
jgi:hypothetical protein